MTPREAARLQTFPDDFIFQGDRRSQCILVGNAVPPLLAAKLAQSVADHIYNVDYEGIDPEGEARFGEIFSRYKVKKI